MSTPKDLYDKLKNLSTIGKKVKYREKGKMGKGKSKVIGEIVDEVSVIEKNGEYKHFIQKIKRLDGTTQYRICYYTINNKKTRIQFGQFAAEIPKENIKELLIKAVQKKGFFE